MRILQIDRGYWYVCSDINLVPHFWPFKTEDSELDALKTSLPVICFPSARIKAYREHT
jgi:hypothetical protein